MPEPVWLSVPVLEAWPLFTSPRLPAHWQGRLIYNLLSQAEWNATHTSRSPEYRLKMYFSLSILLTDLWRC